MDARLVIFRDQPLDHTHFPYLHLDATYCKVRVSHQIVSRAAIIATGITEDSNPEVLGVTVGDNETLAFRAEFLRSLRARGLVGVRLVNAGHHLGPVDLSVVDLVTSRDHGVLLFGLKGEGTQLVAVGRDALLDRLTEVLPQMKPVCDLQVIRGAVRGAFGVGSATVPADHLSSGVSRRPCGQWCRLATRQHLDGPVPFTIRDHSGLRVTAPGGEVVDTEDPWRVVERVGQRPNPVQQPHPPHCQTKGVGHPCPGTVGQRERDPVQQHAQPFRDAGVRAGQRWYLLGKCALRTGAVSAYEAPHREQDPYCVPGRRKILQATLVTVMDTCRRLAARWISAGRCDVRHTVRSHKRVICPGLQPVGLVVVNLGNRESDEPYGTRRPHPGQSLCRLSSHRRVLDVHQQPHQRFGSLRDISEGSKVTLGTNPLRPRRRRCLSQGRLQPTRHLWHTRKPLAPRRKSNPGLKLPTRLAKTMEASAEPEASAVLTVVQQLTRLACGGALTGEEEADQHRGLAVRCL